MEFKKYGEFMARVQGDPELRARVFAAPTDVLAEQGFGIPREVEIRVVEDSAEVWHVILPPSPNAALSDAGMEAVAGGTPHGDRLPIGYVLHLRDKLNFES